MSLRNLLPTGLVLLPPLFVLPSCGSADAGDVDLFAPPFALSELMASWPEAGGVEMCLEVRGPGGASVPHALVQLDWDEGGRTAFQSDERGAFWIRFPSTELASDATITLRTIPDGAQFVTETYEALSSELEGGAAAVTFSGYTPRS